MKWSREHLISNYHEIHTLIAWLSEICLTSLIALFWNFLLFWNFPLMICNFRYCQFQHFNAVIFNNISQNVKSESRKRKYVMYGMNLLSHNNYFSVEVMDLCLLNLLILVDWFLCHFYHCVLFESLSHVINQESHVYSWNLGKKFTSFIF